MQDFSGLSVGGFTSAGVTDGQFQDIGTDFLAAIEQASADAAQPTAGFDAGWNFAPPTAGNFSE